MFFNIFWGMDVKYVHVSYGGPVWEKSCSSQISLLSIYIVSKYLLYTLYFLIDPDGTIAAVDLYKLLLNKDLSIMLMDMRSTMDYAASHIRHDRSINVPTDSVPPG